MASLMVVAIWGRDLLKSPHDKSAQNWFILGVFLHFLGSSADNIYWGIAWHYHYLDHPAAGKWFANGAISNIPFRQLATFAAALCHIQAAYLHTEGKVFSPKKVITIGVVLGIIYGVLLHA